MQLSKLNFEIIVNQQNKCCRTCIEIVSKYIESCRTKSIQEFYVMLVTYRYKFVALKRFVAFKYNFVAIIFCHNQKSNRIQKVIFGGTNQKYLSLN